MLSFRQKYDATNKAKNSPEVSLKNTLSCRHSSKRLVSGNEQRGYETKIDYVHNIWKDYEGVEVR